MTIKEHIHSLKLCIFQSHICCIYLHYEKGFELNLFLIYLFISYIILYIIGTLPNIQYFGFCF